MPASALSQLMAGAKRKHSTALVPVQQTEADKAKAQYNTLLGRRQKYLESKKGAPYWQYLEPVLQEDENKSVTAVKLLCKLCDTLLSATNVARIADTHLKGSGCKVVKSDIGVAQEIAAAFVKGSKDDDKEAAADEEAALEQLQNQLSKRTKQDTVDKFVISKPLAQQIRRAVAEWFLEISDCVALAFSLASIEGYSQQTQHSITH